MPKGSPLSVEQRERIYDLYTVMGVNQADIAEQFGISAATVSRVISTQRKLLGGKRETKMAEIVVAGDKKNGRLTSTGTNRYEGTCLVGGRMKKRSFTAVNARFATQQWEKWCQTLRDEEEFMASVERRSEPTDVAPTTEAIYEAQEAVEKEVVEPFLEKASTPLVTPGPVFAVYTLEPELRFIRYFLTVDEALEKVDEFNSVAAFLGKENAFEVAEIPWKG